LRVIQSQSLDDDKPSLGILTEADGHRYQAAATHIRNGLRQLRDTGAARADDLLPHISLLVVLDQEASAGLISASSRLFPGLILLNEPTCALEVAEALIHEGAHQKLFDLAITRNFLGADTTADRSFNPSWSTRQWPVEQALAGFHAYACLAEFAQDMTQPTGQRTFGPHSLLPVARQRSAEIGRWLLTEQQSLGSDATWLLHNVIGNQAEPARTFTESCALAPQLRITHVAATGRVLVGRPGTPPELYWLDSDAANLVSQLAVAPAGLPLMEILAKHSANTLETLAESALLSLDS
jgi:hypothetical protein